MYNKINIIIIIDNIGHDFFFKSQLPFHASRADIWNNSTDTLIVKLLNYISDKF